MKTFTIWKNGSRHEWIIYEGDAVHSRSGLIFLTRAAALRDLRSREA